MDELRRLLDLPAEERTRLGIEHTAAEIAQQPATWRQTVALCRSRRGELEQFLRSVAGAPAVLAGAGTSDFIGRALDRLLESRWQIPVRAVASTELLTGFEEWMHPSSPSLSPSLLLSFSRSGDSSEGVAVMQETLRRCPQIAHLVITCNGEGAMAKLAAGHPRAMALVLDPSTNDRGLAMTSSFSNMVVAGQALGALSNLEDHERRLEEMARVAEDLLPRAAESAMHLAGQRFRRVCFLGSNALAATAMESALKVQELTAGRIFSMSQSFLGLRHGPLSFLNEETLVVAYLASGRLTRLYELDLLRELKKKRLGVTIAATGFSIAEPLAGIADVVHDLGPEGAVPDDLRPPLDVILGQMLGLFCSLQAGLTPDTPSPSGAISRVVSHLRIHTEQLVEGAR